MKRVTAKVGLFWAAAGQRVRATLRKPSSEKQISKVGREQPVPVHGRKGAARGWPMVSIVLPGGLIALWGFFGILEFAGVRTISNIPQHLAVVRISPLDRSLHGQVISAAVTLLGILGGLVTYWATWRQKETHHEELMASTRDSEKRRARHERDLAELQRMEAEFAALAEALERESPMARINAVIGLAEIAIKPDPRRVQENGELELDHYVATSCSVPFHLASPDHDKSDASDMATVATREFRSRKTDRNYPYLMRAAERLAFALTHWTDDASQSQALRQIELLAKFAKDADTDEPLLHLLVNAAAHANRTAWKRLQYLAHHYHQAGRSIEDVEAFVNLEPRLAMLYDPELRDICREAFYMLIREEPKIIAPLASMPKSVMGVKVQATVAAEEVKSAAETFWATQSALEAALARLSRPCNLEELPPPLAKRLVDANPHYLEGWRDEASDWKYSAAGVWGRRSLQLHEVNLSFANLDGAQIQLADLTGAQLIGASFRQTNVEGTLGDNLNAIGANLKLARLFGATCRYASFEYADLSTARLEAGDFEEASFRNVIARGTKFDDSVFDRAIFSSKALERASFVGADLTGALFVGARCRRTDFRHAILRDTDLGSADLGLEYPDSAIFSPKGWSEASFSTFEWDSRARDYVRTNFINHELKAALERRFPGTQ